MAKRITAYVAADGTLFTDPAECAKYEKTTVLGAGVVAALSLLGLSGALVVKAGDKDGETAIDLQEFLLKNSEILVEALSPAKPKRKSPEAKVEAKPGVVITTTDQAADLAAAIAKEVAKEVAAPKVEINPIKIEAAETPAETPAVQTTPVDSEAGNSAEEELEKLLGGGEVSL